MELNGRKLGPGEPCYIIAEIGQNHQGDAYTACRLIQMAEKCGVDAVKLQARSAVEEFSVNDLNEPYTGRNSFGATYWDHREALDLTRTDFAHLKDRHHYNSNECDLFTTVCAPCWIDWLEREDWCRFYKIASKDMRNQALIETLAKTGKPLILSTGMAETMHAISQSYNWAACHTSVAVMHCVSAYPVAHEDVNLKAIDTLRQELGCPVGYSDHSAGVKAPVTAAMRYNADLIEVHITANRALPGSDHAASLEEPGLNQLVQWIRQAEKMDGTGALSKPTVVAENRKKYGVLNQIQSLY